LENEERNKERKSLQGVSDFNTTFSWFMDSIVVVVDSWIQSISFGFEDFLMDLINFVCCWISLRETTLNVPMMKVWIYEDFCKIWTQCYVLLDFFFESAYILKNSQAQVVQNGKPIQQVPADWYTRTAKGKAEKIRTGGRTKTAALLNYIQNSPLHRSTKQHPA
jgi:hypothetical protein